MSEPFRRVTVLVVGHVCLDSVAVVARPAGADEKVEALKAWVGGGGPAANAAVALRRLGHEVRLWCAFGDDAAGRVVGDELRGEQIQLLQDAVLGETSFAQIRAVDAGRSIVWKRGQLPALRFETTDPGTLLDGVDVLYLDGHEVAVGTALLAEARRRGVPCFADLGTFREGIEGWLADLEWLYCTPRFVRGLAGDMDLRSGLEVLSARAGAGRPVGITLGERGGWSRIAGAVRPWIARKTGVVDSTGAGDAFHAGLADGSIQGWEIDRCLEWAATLGAAVCRGPGGRIFLPSDRAQLTKWHGRWGAHEALSEDSLVERCA